MTDDFEYIHYSAKTITKVRSVEQKTELYMKPDGLWFSVEDGWGWADWCRQEEWSLDKLCFEHKIKFKKDARIILIKNEDDLDAFTKLYQDWPEFDTDCMGSMFIDWIKVATKYQGIIIAPYQWGRRLHMDSSWYYGWDCSSGCVWDASAIERFFMWNVMKDGVMPNDR